MKTRCMGKKGLVALLAATMLLSGCGNTGGDDKPVEDEIVLGSSGTMELSDESTASADEGTMGGGTEVPAANADLHLEEE